MTVTLAKLPPLQFRGQTPVQLCRYFGDPCSVRHLKGHPLLPTVQVPSTVTGSSRQHRASPGRTEGQGAHRCLLCPPPARPSLRRGGCLAQKFQGHQERVQGADPSCLPSRLWFTCILRGLGHGLAGLLLPPGACPGILSSGRQALSGCVGLRGGQAHVHIQHMFNQGIVGQAQQLLAKRGEQVEDHCRL